MRIALTCSIKPKVIQEEDKEKYAEFDSSETIYELAKAIKSHKHEVEILNVTRRIKQILKNRKEKIDLVFNVAEGLKGENREAIVPKICEESGMPFTASGSETLLITLNKARTKEILEKHNIPTPKYQVFNNEDDELILNFPLLVKPLLEGSSKGLFNENLVNDREQLKKIVKKIKKNYNQQAIVEEFLDGREFTVSVIGNGNPIVLPIVEIKYDHLPENMNPMDSYETKWLYDSPEFIEKNKVEPVVCPTNIAKELESKINEIAIKTYSALNCKDWTRIDMRLDKDGVVNVLEVNALPGFMKDPKENSRLPKAAYAAGWSYEKLIGEVLKSAMKRWNLK